MKDLIPNISQKISNILERLKVLPSISPKEFIKKTSGGKHRYLSLCTDRKGQKLIFYARLHKNPDAKRKMIAEISFLKKCSTLLKISSSKTSKFKEKGKRLEISQYIPRFYLARIEKDFEWFSREYFPGFPLGTNERLKRKIKKKNVSILAEAIWQIKNTQLAQFQALSLRKFTLKNYLDAQNSIFDLRKKKVLSKKLSEEIIKHFKKNSVLLKRENRYLSHGDFNLGNLIIQKGDLKILDWESIQINNLAFDIAYLFSHLWQAQKKIRKKLIEDYLELLSPKEKIAFKKLFPIVIFYLAVGGVEAKPAEISLSLLKKRKEFFKKLLKNTALGFNHLISI